MSPGIENIKEFPDFYHGIHSALAKFGYNAVHIFFYLGAFLATYLMLKSCPDSSSVPVPKILIFRILRILPTYAFLTLMIFPMTRVVEGPFSGLTAAEAEA